VGNVKYRDVLPPPGTWLVVHDELYEHDTLDRLTRFDRGVLNEAKDAISWPQEWPVGLPPLVRSRDWDGLDLLGNWRSFVTTNIAEEKTRESRTVNAVNEYGERWEGDLGLYKPIAKLSHDDNGNLIDDGSQLYEYDAENRLIRITYKISEDVLREYAYDALGRRVRTVYWPNHFLGPKVSTHVYGGGVECLAEYDNTDPTRTRRASAGSCTGRCSPIRWSWWT